ncbi:hypothetical protein [Microvirga arabica]|nr:hypothetical protein [Microvirga arabica]MBM1170058.1 hypothetical protein [Microvirga arabica]
MSRERRRIDLSRMYWRGNDLLLHTTTKAELDALPEWKEDWVCGARP